MEKTVYVWGEKGRFENYRRAVKAAGGRVVFCKSAIPDSAIWDALLLPGGGDLEPWRYGQENTASRGLEPERDQMEMALLERYTSAGKPVLGICRGLQSINVYFGGTLVQDIPGHSAVDGVDRLHPVVTADSPLLGVCGAEAVVNSAHHQAVDRLGSGLEAVQWTADNVVEALCHRTLTVWGVQWHPERLAGPVGVRLLGAFLEQCR